MKTKKINSLITNLYHSHNNIIITKENPEYLKLFEQFHDLISNIESIPLKTSILNSYIKIENLLFNNIIATSKQFYKLGFDDLKETLLENKNISKSKIK